MRTKIIVTVDERTFLQVIGEYQNIGYIINYADDVTRVLSNGRQVVKIQLL